MLFILQESYLIELSRFKRENQIQIGREQD